MRTRFAAMLPAIAALAAAGVWMFSRTAPSSSSAPTHTVSPGVFELWIPLLGKVEAAQPVSLRAELDGVSKLVFLVEDGLPVQRGDVVARFDNADLEERRRILDRDREIARAALAAMTEAEHPLELQQLEQELRGVEGEIRKEDLLRSETRALVDEELLAPEELAVFEETLATLRSRKQALERRLHLTRTVLHPAAEQTARARLDAAEAGLERVRSRLEATEVRAPVDGTVHRPRIPIDGERRPARVGDGLYRNQVYLQLSDLTDLVVRAEIGESLLSRVVPGMEAIVRLPAFPTRSLRARVASVGAYPVGDSGRYPVELRWMDPPTDLRPGLTARVEVLSERREDALTVPREFLEFSGGPGDPARVRTARGLRTVDTGPENAAGVVVESGVESGAVLIRP